MGEDVRAICVDALGRRCNIGADFARARDEGAFPVPLFLGVRMMADRPIIFSGPMVRALLDGRKTQTRRILGGRGQCNIFEPGVWADSYVMDPGNADWRTRDTPYAIGDRLYVRESIYFWSAGHDCEITFAADGAARQTGPNTGEIPDVALPGYFAW